ncbi:TolC family protein [Flavobacterium sp. GT3R68]|uniref:TolC family protein n=1 Tax=Flavobacterium sp. GT3R68 TaxID=2594437 RepID=UPI000F86521E|nr:TolC family protein [Flavobacterium sp. GT3R68]RTY91822.1 TolC family protein [Flavobacterium sp. GSN2]TRW90162.1 TolC family protein [Flavobacterium sp. GT3R68]
MKRRQLLLYAMLFFGFTSIQAQQKTNLNLREAIELALTKSNEVNLANTKAETKKYELESMKNNQYPDFKVSGQYLRLTNAKVDSNLSSGDSNGPPPKIDQLIIGQVNTSLPLFSGFKLKNSIKASESLHQAEKANAAQTKEEIAMRVVEYYANLYRAQKAVHLITENLKSAEQRVTDFTAMEQNGIIARNDLLKSQLQQSKVQLSLDEAYKNVAVINYYLVTLLHLPEDYRIGIDEHQFDDEQPINIIHSEENALKNRKDLEAVHFLQKASECNIKIAKSGYYPSIALVGGYAYLDLKNAITVTNAINFGVGVSYDLSSIFKNGSFVKTAKSKSLETQQTESILSENIKVEVQQSIENYNLALKQNLVYKQAINQAAENYRIVKDKYDNGLSNTTDLLEADVEQLNSRINHAYSKANIMLKYYEMQSVSGQLTQSFNLSK